MSSGSHIQSHLRPNGSGAQRVRRRPRSSGFTLAEALVAMTMLTIITAATTLAISASLRTREILRSHADLETEGRTALRLLSRDFRSAYASTYNPNTFFVAQGNDTGILVQFTTLAHRITVTPIAPDTAPSGTPITLPQSGIALVSYSFDPDAGTLSRCETSIPNPDTLPDPSDPTTVIARHILEVSINYLDANGNLRPYWNFTNQQASAQAGATGAAAPTTSTGDEDTTLPVAIQIQVRVGTPNGPSADFSTTVTPITPEPQSTGQTPQATTSGGGGSSGAPPQGGSSGNAPPAPGPAPGGSGGGLPGLPGTGARP